MTTVHTVRSADGTTIAYEELGRGPRPVLVHGGVSDRTYWAPVEAALAKQLTVVTVDRRGRGDSGDTEPYAVAREAEDLMAVVDAFVEPVHLLGHSYGGILGTLPCPSAELCTLMSCLRTARRPLVPTKVLSRP